MDFSPSQKEARHLTLPCPGLMSDLSKLSSAVWKKLFYGIRKGTGNILFVYSGRMMGKKRHLFLSFLFIRSTFSCEPTP